MQPAQSLLTMLTHAERERDAIFVETQRLAQAHLSAQHQIEQLLGYRQDYQQRWTEQFKRSRGIDIVQCYQGFMSRLDQAIDQQERATMQAVQNCARAAQALRRQETYVASVRKLLERRAGELRKAQDRQMQKQADDQTAMRWGRQAKTGVSSTLGTPDSRLTFNN